MQNLKKIGKIFRVTTLVMLFITITIMGGLWIFTSYLNFKREAEQLKTDYIASQRELVQKEVEKVIEEIEFHKSKTEEKLREVIRERVYEAYNIAMNIYDQNKEVKSNREIEELIAKTFSGVTYNNGRGYYFWGRVDDQTLLFADRSEFEGKQMHNYRSPEGKHVFRDFVELVRTRGEGFYEYMWAHPGMAGNDHRKISFVKYFEPLNLWLGSGEYYEDFQREQQAELLEEISLKSYGRDGYFFVLDFNGINLAIGDENQKQRVLKSDWELEDLNGVKFIQRMRRVAEEKEGGFVYYKWLKPSKNMAVDKMTFVKGIQEWKWLVGTGLYMDDINDTIAAKRKALMRESVKNIEKIIVIMFFLSAMVVLIEFYILKRVKALIRYEENIYETLLNLSMEGIYLRNSQGKILDCNKNIPQMLGYTREELLSLSLDDLVLKEPGKDPLTMGCSSVGGNYRELIFRKKNGTLLTAEINTSPLEIEREKRQITFLRDITKRKRMERYLKELSRRDGLTQLYNRRYIFKKMKSELERSRARGVSLSISMIDIDHFKKINDTFGHMVGDEVLKRVAKTLQENLRDGDHVGRYGGEEFLIVLPNTKLSRALEVIERLRLIVGQLEWEEKELTVTFSGGVTEIDSKRSFNKVEELVDEVDRLLYRAKVSGRNRVEF
ncbi:hypothetical protein PM10SUCC1_34610 [Propionigenium maris DSM 9537]|uniref:PAS domain S-box-containing protein/diguanylate cyclase (GGDEF) domain-containing protein n=1 Tax=Propionigenium maris DSM 9537 TaxID=1123000 RepID=A0A9W6LPT5_9FUSO|nr:cache domain-containing protein [Propionigenium maris]GLI57947.1 hypothetical protein PM10SUCC1_34610 [Propionigenium maris DSM 9537]